MNRVVTISEYPWSTFNDVVTTLASDGATLFQDATDLAADQVDRIVIQMHTRWAWFDRAHHDQQVLA